MKFSKSQPLLDKLPSDRHLQEWINSCVLPEIIAANVISCVGDNAYERLLYGLDRSDRLNTGRLREKWLKRYDHLDHGGWWCSGIDLISLEPSLWGCFKPDRPKLYRGKALKYESPPNCRTGIFALDVRGKALEKFPECTRDKIDPKFWEWVIGNTRFPIVITEGAKKAGAVLSQGVAAIALSGIYNFTDDELLKPEIRRLIGPGREFIIAFDQDSRWNVRNNVTAALKKLAEQLQDSGAQVSILHWEYEDGKGIDDFIALNGSGEFSELIQNRLELSEYLETHAQPYECKRIDQFAKFLDTQIKDLQYNLLTGRVEWEGKPIELSGELQFKLLYDYNIIVSEEKIVNGFLYKAKQNSYHPVKKYLDNLTASPISIDDLSQRYFGTTDPFYDLLVKKWLIGAVARIFEPGCQFDNALILQGEQWAGKSQFFKVLGGKYFDDSFGTNFESTKSLLTLHSCWIEEWSEFDKITGKQDFNAIKDFLTRQTDNFVPPYGRESIEHPRMSVMGGSINPAAFLKDATGDRRFWVVPLAKGWKVPTSQLQSERDQIWAAAVKAYRAGESRYLDQIQYENHKKINEQFRDSDIWLSAIENWLMDRKIQRFSIERILLECLGFTIDKIDTKSRNRIRDCLISLGCTPVGSRRESEYDGKARRVWQSPEKFPSQVLMDEPDNGDNDDNGSNNGSVVTQNQDTARLTTLTTANNGKNQNFSQLDDGETYEEGLIKVIVTHCDRLKWDSKHLSDFIFIKFGKTSLELLPRSNLMDLTILLSETKEDGTSW
jgi:hypothetical protein